MLSLYKLEIFNTVAMEGSFSKAAERLLLSQPAVSQHIRDLEASLQITLFDRRSRGVTLTPAGETLLDYTRCILRMVVDAEAALANLNGIENAQLDIGSTPGAGVHLLPGWIQSFQKRFPQTRVSLTTNTTSEIAAGILARRLDIGFVEGEMQEDPALQVLPLREIELFVMVGPGHAWWEQNSIPIESLNQQPFITRPQGSKTREWIDQVFSQHHITPNIIAEFDRPEAILSAVAAGMGITILPDWGTTGEPGGRLRAVSIDGVRLSRMLKLIWSSEGTVKPAARAFLAQLVDLFPQLAPQTAGALEAGLVLPGRQEYRASLSCKD